ncbi:MAG: cytochrome C oxidase subunit IV family protein [Gemmatimonadaceae bacterium]|nr:cytochrome C oxidase subunit IV family protein [Gemmatimonadaceae bacterium]
MSDSAAIVDRAHADHKAHPTWKQYKWVALWLTVITAVEVWVYYTPFRESPLFAPTLLAMSAAKFAIVVMFYMHLKYDHWVFRRLFVGSLVAAMGILMALLFLFSKLKIG